MPNLFLDLCQTLVAGGILLCLARAPAFRPDRHRSARLILAGFVLILLDSLLDLADHPGILGRSAIHPYLQQFPGMLAGLICLLLGLLRLRPELSRPGGSVALHESEEYFRLIFQTSPDVIMVTRVADGMILNVNDNFSTVSGFRREDVIGTTSYSLDLWHDTHERDQYVALLQQQGQVRNFEMTARIKDGVLRNFLVSARLLTLDKQPCILGVARDITELKRATAALRESEERFRTIFEAIPDPVSIYHLQTDKVIAINRGYAERTGYTPEEIVGSNALDLNLWVVPAEREVFMETIRREGQVDNQEVAVRLKDGSIRTGLVSARRVSLNNDPCLLIITRDISELIEAERVLQNMDRIKTEFISTAAHELRTPLASVMGYADALLHPEHFGGLDADQQREFLQVIANKSVALARIIDDLLDISRIEKGDAIYLEKSPCQPVVLVTRIVKQFRMRYPKRRFEIALEEIEELIAVDEDRMTQVLENLLSNALKYSDEQSPVEIRGERRGAEYLVTVRDHGIGMDPEQLARVFDKFYRADASNTAVGGLGLGMGIARQIIETHGGRIWLESQPGQGTSVYFTLPNDGTGGLPAQ